MLGCKPEHYIRFRIGKEMIANRKLFLSQRAVASFGGYANQQLRRLENAIAREHCRRAGERNTFTIDGELHVAFERKYTALRWQHCPVHGR
jgi:hypothetical protein